MKFHPEAQNVSAPARTKVQSGNKRPASKTIGPPRKRHIPATSLSHQVAELSNAVQGIRALLTKSFPSASSNVHGGMVTCGPVPSLPGSRPAAEGSRKELDVLSIAASDSLLAEKQDHFKMALAKLNLDLPSPTLGPSNLLRHPVVQPGDFQIPSCPDYTGVVFSAFRAAPSSRPDRVARTLAAMAEAQERGLGSMPPVESCISSLVVSPDEALKQELRCPNLECRRTDDLLVCAFNTVSGLTRLGNSMAHLLLALHSTMATTESDNTSFELLDASLQALGSVAFSSGKAFGLITQTRRQVWLAQSKLPEACRNSLRRLSLVPGQVFGPAAQEALERTACAAESRSQHIGRTVSYPALAAHRMTVSQAAPQQSRQEKVYRPPQRDARPATALEGYYRQVASRHAREGILSSVPSQISSDHSGVSHGGPGPSSGPGPFRRDKKSVEVNELSTTRSACYTMSPL
ncbi:hypothetical protein IRJ41_005391 [Triplophysa rosa]|uniref:Uncharacterized protein n=1 Tax=Triplophysa rosa TaxID=992332 RepID=A0A9W7WDI8_TRIRA|nr:hypothetical protein IRJ41_005391 [Triplophysa rosa]